MSDLQKILSQIHAAQPRTFVEVEHLGKNPSAYDILKYDTGRRRNAVVNGKVIDSLLDLDYSIYESIDLGFPVIYCHQELNWLTELLTKKPSWHDYFIADLLKYSRQQPSNKNEIKNLIKENFLIAATEKRLLTMYRKDSYELKEKILESWESYRRIA